MKKSFSTFGWTWLVLLAIVLSSQAGLGRQEIPVEVSPEKVGKYEKVEFLIRVDARCRNPFDAER